MKLSRIASEFSYGDWVIHKFGVKDDGSHLHSRANFRDWFYFRADQIGQLTPFDKIDIDLETVYKSIYGEDCYRVTYTSIKVKNNIMKAFPDYTYEADVTPEFKYLMQSKTSAWSDASERNIGYFDIETFTDSEEFAGPDNAFAPITSIQLHSSRQDHYYMIAWHEVETEHLTVPELVTKGNTTYIFCKDEVDVVLSFFELVSELKIDILTGWFSAGFDLPYICERCDRIGVDYNALSPIGKVTHYSKGYEWKTYIEGIDHIDMMEAVAEVGYNLPNNKLATAMKEILKDEDCEKLTEFTWKDWRDNFKEFMKYGLRDVEGLVKIDRALGIFDLFCTIQQLTNITKLGDISFKSSVVDKFIMSDCRDKFVFPTRQTAKKQDYMGATVLEPKWGLWNDVGLVDYASLYPTTVMSFNLSPETFICSQAEVEGKGMTIDQVIEELNRRGVKYIDTGYNEELIGLRYLFYGQETKLGVLPHVLKKMYEERRRIKARMKGMDKNSPEYNAQDKHQYALKIILNSAYGAFGFNYFRLYKVEVADAITFFSRRALEFAITNLEQIGGYEVIYGDTDSCFFKLESNGGSHGLGVPFNSDWVNWYNDNLKTTFIPTYHNGDAGEYAMLELEWEKSFDCIYFGATWQGGKKTGKLVGTKKRYYGIEKETRKKYIKGLNIIRKDAPPFLKVRLNELTEDAVTGQFTLDKLLGLRKEIESQPYETIGVTKSFGQPFKLYKVKANHVEGAKFANEILGTKITHKDTPFLFFIKSKCEEDAKPKERHDSICLLPADLHFIDERTDLFEIDYTVYFAKQVTDQLEPFNHIQQVADVLKQYKESLTNA